MEDFIKYAKNKVYFYIESKFWSKLDITTFHAWLSNFDTIEEKYCALKLLDRFVFYSEEDMIRLLQFGFFELIFKRKALEKEVTHNFNLSNGELNKLKNDFIRNALVLPLRTDNLSESSLAMARYLTNDFGFPEENIIDQNNLKSEELLKSRNLIIIDDFIGSSNQLFNFWNFETIKLDNEDITPKELRKMFPNLEVEYFCLVSSEDGLSNFHFNNVDVGLRITFCEKLTNKYKVFGKDSVYFDNEEVECCKNILDLLCKRKGIPLFGYTNLDYAMAFHHSIPDSSLPLFYSQNKNWNPLFKNKNTFVHDSI